MYLSCVSLDAVAPSLLRMPIKSVEPLQASTASLRRTCKNGVQRVSTVNSRTLSAKSLLTYLACCICRLQHVSSCWDAVKFSIKVHSFLSTEAMFESIFKFSEDKS